MKTDRLGRPRLIIGPPSATQPPDSVRVEVLGTVASELGARERGFRVRTERGNELTLVREPGRAWYVDDAPHLALAFSETLEPGSSGRLPQE